MGLCGVPGRGFSARWGQSSLAEGSKTYYDKHEHPIPHPPPLLFSIFFAAIIVPPLNVFGFNMHRRILSRRSLGIASLVTGTVLGGGYYYLNSGPSYPLPTKDTRRPPPPWTPPSRKEMHDALVKSGSSAEDQFDVLIVGGGATGAGVAVDAATRGLKVALVERDDFSSGTWWKTTPFSNLTRMCCRDRYLFEVDETCTRWCTVPPESRVRARLRTVQTRQGGFTRTQDLSPNRALSIQNASHHATSIQVI